MPWRIRLSFPCVRIIRLSFPCVLEPLRRIAKSCVDAQNGPATIESNLVNRGARSSAGKMAGALGEMDWEVKVGALHKVPMWDFVQAVVVATRVMEIRFGIWELPQVSGTSEVCLPSAWEKAWLPWC
ncbi:hypothetical protein L3X38_018356 [Prunus dulcis]|uniref:Uncharacterized protein n=1 Tax=Prunus dulcis TaxID=3755 RepID=A0AAD4ZB17_PRUDU|nr:hypothetical protein L3X38_018356 [Prunus dulcis]